MKPITIESAADERTEEEKARAAPVSLPAGSYEHKELSSALDASTKAKHDKDRDEVQQAALAELNQTDLPTESLGLTPGYTRVEVTDKSLGVTEERVVFDEGQEEAADAAVDPAAAAPATDKGE